MRRWQVGGVTIVRVESVELTLPSERPLPAWAVPHLVPATDTTAIAFSAFGIVDGDRRIVVDPWLAGDSPRAAPDAATSTSDHRRPYRVVGGVSRWRGRCPSSRGRGARA